MIFLLIALWSAGIMARVCDNSQIKYEFTECQNGKRKMFFYWNQDNCTNALPKILENLSCEEKCREGQYLGFSPDSGTTSCLDCPPNTYSTGSTLRFSSLDANWGSLPQDVQRLCYWVTPSNEWTCQPCDSFKANSNGTAIVLNPEAIRPNTFNLLEFKMSAFLYDAGNISFEYKKVSKLEPRMLNGWFQFIIDKVSGLLDRDLHNTATQSPSFILNAGYKEFRWLYFVDSRADISNLKAEISKIEITPVNYAPLNCTACRVGNSGIGSSSCAHCKSNSYFNSFTKTCAACPETEMAYEGQSQCSKRPSCSLKYDTLKKFSECKDGTRTLSYIFRQNTICNTSTPIKYNGPTKLPCTECKPGYKLSGDSCEKCPSGMYSDTKNSNYCHKCPAGNYVKLNEVYESFEEFPSAFGTFCENQKGSVNYCSLHSGWIVAHPDLAPPPHLPPGINIILRLNLTIVDSVGIVSFKYSIVEKLSTLKENLLVRVDGNATILSMKKKHKPTTIRLTKGSHIIDWIYSVTQDVSTPVLLNSVKVSGTGKGDANECVKCPDGAISEENSLKCSSCDAGMSSNSNHTACEPCPEGFFKYKPFETCQKCPKHTFSQNSREKCELYDAFNYEDEYLLNMMKFDSTLDCDISERRDLQTDNGFFGPFKGHNNNLFFFSPKKANTFNSQQFEFENSTVSQSEGHAFLLKIKQEISQFIIHQNNFRKSYYRKKINIGSSLTNFTFNKGNIILEYGNGDICEQNLRYSTKIQLVCDINETSLMNLKDISTKKCQFSFIWKTPRACSVCLLEKTVKSPSFCNLGEREIYLEENSGCKLDPFLQASNLTVENILQSGPENFNYSVETTEQIDIRGGKFFHEFVFSNKYTEPCNEYEISQLSIIIAISIFLVFVVALVICLYFSMKYRKAYYQILDEQNDSRNNNRLESLDSDKRMEAPKP